MQTRKLGDTSVEVSIVGIGGWQMGGPDTPDGNGHSEAVIGRAMVGRRDRWVIATKGGRVKNPEKRGEYKDYSASHIRDACEASLGRLGTDYIDFYQLHGDLPDEALVEEHAGGLNLSFLWEGTGRTPAQAALRFVVDQPGVTAAIPGTKKMEHLEDNVGATDVAPLTAEELQRVEEVATALAEKRTHQQRR